MSVTGHKLGGPVGTGALVVRDGISLRPRQLGGGQERDRRSGTQDVAGAVGLARALELAVAEREEAVAAVARDARPARQGPRSRDPPDDADRLPNICHVCFDGVAAESLLFLLDDAGVCASRGLLVRIRAPSRPATSSPPWASPSSAPWAPCASPSRPSTTDAEIDRVLELVPPCLERLRS